LLQREEGIDTILLFGGSLKEGERGAGGTQIDKNEKKKKATRGRLDKGKKKKEGVARTKYSRGEQLGKDYRFVPDFVST